MDASWKTYVENLCSDAWALGPFSTKKVIEGIEVLIATDQLSDFSLVGVLSSVGVQDSYAGAAAPSIRHTIRGGAVPS